MRRNKATIENRRFGIEIEVERLTTEQARFGLRLPRGWKVTSDGSLRNGSEMVSPPMTIGDFAQVEQVLRQLRNADAKTSERCSIHIHVDGSGFDLESIKRLVKNTRAYEPWIYQIARGGDGEHRGGRNGNHYRFCKPIEEVHRSGETDYDRLVKANNFKRFWEVWYGRPRQELPGIFSCRYNPTRYRGLNLHSFNYRGTIEFRYFDGTLNPADIKAWVTLCLRLVLKSLNEPAVLRGVKVMEPSRNPLYRLASGLRLTAEERELFHHNKLVWKGV
jgi:hypothetical protein